MILAGDIGGTKTNVALFDADGDAVGTPLAQKSYPTSQYNSLEAILTEFVAEQRPRITAACFGVAGPVVAGRVETPNLAWVVSRSALAAAVGTDRVALINDLEAMAFGIVTLRREQLYTLNEGEGARPGHRALIAAGTGLGMAGIFWDGHHYHPIPSEGGHVDFAPRNELEVELLRYLREKVGGRVSYERVLSGPGLFNIYGFLRDRGYAEEPEWLATQIITADAAAAVSAAALAGRSELARKALEVFVEIYGAMAGNLALVMKAAGGVYVGGGIAPKIIEKLKDGTFMRAYLDKGRMSFLVESMPVRVILDDRAALYGAARCALEMQG